MWKLFFEKHPPIDKSLGYPAKYPRGCCAIVLDDGLVWDPGEHIGHAVSGLIVKAHNGELDGDGGVWRRELESRSDRFLSAYRRATQ